MKKEYLFIVFLVILAITLRFWNFRGYLSFLDDQGRDAIVAKQILIDHNLTLLGPRTSVGNMYLGPLYYYAMVPFLAMTYPDPTGPAYAIAVLGVITVALVYLIGKRLVGARAAAIAALLYAVSPWVIELARFSWQPNPAPFVGLLMMFFTVQALKGKTSRWFLVAVCFAILIQLHYISLLAAFPTAILFVIDYWKHREKKGVKKHYFTIIFASLCALVLSQLPLVVFDLRHDRVISRGFDEFFQSQHSSSPPLQRVSQFFIDMHGRGMFLLIEQLGFSKEIRFVNTILLLVMGVVVALQLLPRTLRKNPYKTEFITIALWVGTGLFGLSAYRNVIYPHYFAYLFPAIFLLVGASLDFLARRHNLLKILTFGSVLALVAWNVTHAPYWKPKTVDVDRMRQVVADLLPYTRKPVRYNIALLNDNREYRGMKYRYFFEVSENPPQSEYDYDNLDVLVIITENEESPLRSPIFEIQQFVNETKRPRLVTSQIYQGIVHAYLYEREE